MVSYLLTQEISDCAVCNITFSVGEISGGAVKVLKTLSSMYSMVLGAEGVCGALVRAHRISYNKMEQDVQGH